MPATRSHAGPLLVSVCLALVACYPSAASEPDSPTQTPAPPPPTVGVQVYGDIIAQPPLSLDGAGASVEVRDASCTNVLPGIAGTGGAPGPNPGSSYSAHLTAQRSPFSACVVVRVTYVVNQAPNGLEAMVQVPVTFTAAGAQRFGQPYRRDVIVP